MFSGMSSWNVTGLMYLKFALLGSFVKGMCFFARGKVEGELLLFMTPQSKLCPMWINFFIVDF